MKSQPAVSTSDHSSASLARRDRGVGCIYAHIGRAWPLLIAAGLAVLLIACTGTHRMVMNADRLPANTLIEEDAKVEVMFASGQTKTGSFDGVVDSLMYISVKNRSTEIALDSVAYVTYLHPLRHTAHQRRLGLARGIGIGLLDAAILTLIYSSADGSVSKGTIFAVTAITVAVPLTIYFTAEAGHKGQELDEKEIADISGRMARESK